MTCPRPNTEKENVRPDRSQARPCLRTRLRSLFRRNQDSGPGRTLVLIATDRLGRGDDELGSRLMLNFLKTLPELSPWRLVLVNGGVRLCTAEHPARDALASLAATGVRIQACATCLEFFDLLHRQQVGEPTNMVDIITAMDLADKVITL